MSLLRPRTMVLRLTRFAQTNQLANEESVEAIIRKRTLDGEPKATWYSTQMLKRDTAFRSRCPFFTPHPNDSVGRGWWDLADSGRRGKGPDLC